MFSSVISEIASEISSNDFFEKFENVHTFTADADLLLLGLLCDPDSDRELMVAELPGDLVDVYIWDRNSDLTISREIPSNEAAEFFASL